MKSEPFQQLQSSAITPFPTLTDHIRPPISV
jgi:hypothetical protein